MNLFNIGLFLCNKREWVNLFKKDENHRICQSQDGVEIVFSDDIENGYDGLETYKKIIEKKFNCTCKVSDFFFKITIVKCSAPPSPPPSFLPFPHWSEPRSTPVELPKNCFTEFPKNKSMDCLAQSIEEWLKKYKDIQLDMQSTRKIIQEGSGPLIPLMQESIDALEECLFGSLMQIIEKIFEIEI